jgi:hypothetical protein
MSKRPNPTAARDPLDAVILALSALVMLLTSLADFPRLSWLALASAATMVWALALLPDQDR